MKKFSSCFEPSSKSWLSLVLAKNNFDIAFRLKLNIDILNAKNTPNLERSSMKPPISLIAS